MGWECRDVDIVNASSDPSGPGQHDLTSEALWRSLIAGVEEGTFQFVFMGTPCETFSVARNGPPGPRALRSAEHRYGLPKGQLTPAEADQVSLGTYFALQSARIADTASACGVPWALENPEPRHNPVSLFLLPEFVALAKAPGVQQTDFDQCTFGAASTKPTRILGKGVSFGRIQGRCQHPKTWQSWTGRTGSREEGRVAHPPLVGKDSSGRYKTHAAAAYPAALNQVLAEAISATSQGVQ